MPQLSQDTAGDLIAWTPSYEFRSAGKLCTACGAIIRNVRGDDQIHDQWHQALAVLLATLPFGAERQGPETAIRLRMAPRGGSGQVET